MNKERIVYIAPAAVSFVRSDLEALEPYYEVSTCFSDWTNAISSMLSFIKQLILFPRKIKGCRAILISSGGAWAILPVLFARLYKIPSILILNGSECANIPQLHCGSLRGGFQRWTVQFVLKRVSHIAPVSQSLVETNNEYASHLPKKQGYKAWLPDVTTPYTVVANGFDLSFWSDDDSTRLPKTILTVLSSNRLELKGGLLLLECAKQMPDYHFHFVGIVDSDIDFDLSQNVTCHGMMTPKSLRQLYRTTSIYVQASYFEGFGCSLAEAMLCGCIPIVSNVNAMPAIVASEGYVLTKPVVSELISLLKTASAESSTSKRASIANHIGVTYPISNRITKLRDIIGRL